VSGTGIPINRGGGAALPAEPERQAPPVDPQQMLLFVVQNLHATIERLAVELQHVAERMAQQQQEIVELQGKLSAPREILRDHTGRAVGLRTTA
jgi:hypothetical protein